MPTSGIFDHFDPDLYDPEGMGAAGQGGGDEIRRPDHQAPRRLLPVRLANTPITNAPTPRPGGIWYANMWTPSVRKGCISAFTTPSSTGTIPISPSIPSIPAGTIPTPNSKTRAATCAAMRSTCEIRWTELLTNYGKIDILWFDFSYPGQPIRTAKHWHEGQGEGRLGGGKADRHWPAALQPGIIIDNRTGIEQDLWTPEQYQPQEWIRHPETGELVVPGRPARPSPAPGAIIGTKHTWKSPEMLHRCCSSTPFPCGGNLLMNVGPTARGYLRLPRARRP